MFAIRILYFKNQNSIFKFYFLRCSYVIEVLTPTHDPPPAPFGVSPRPFPFPFFPAQILASSISSARFGGLCLVWGGALSPSLFPLLPSPFCFPLFSSVFSLVGWGVVVLCIGVLGCCGFCFGGLLFGGLAVWCYGAGVAIAP